MSYQYDNLDAHRLPFRDDEAYGCMLADIANALNVLDDAVARCHDEDVRCEEVQDALQRIRRESGRHAAINGFRRALHVRHPDEREMQLGHYLNEIRGELERVGLDSL